MVLSADFYDYLEELSAIDNWDKLPKDDVRIIKLNLLADATTEVLSKRGHVRKKVAAYKGGKFVRAFESAAEAAEHFGTTSQSVQAVARNERRSIGEYEFVYIVGDKSDE